MNKLFLASVVVLSLTIANSVYSESIEGINPSLAQELAQAGVKPEKVTSRDFSDFFDGDFTLTAALIDALMSNKLFRNDLQQRDELKKMVNEGKTLFFPWSTEGVARLVVDGGDAMAELIGDTTISQDIIFMSKNASIEWNMVVPGSAGNGIFEVALTGPAASCCEASSDEIILETYRLSNVSGQSHFSISLSQNQKFLQKMAEANASTDPFERRMNIIFRLKAPGSSSGTPISVRLDDFRITYGS